ncbi:hypothetical protein [Streptomyces otsuchiensis]|uniref:hypothetical protein n=1 Tax=Streptomyces otsuchiensis TaxID=2681388 RepID=UPI00102F3F19|nr:hypothetical protein [Streptomyces otsuchiensis]
MRRGSALLAAAVVYVLAIGSAAAQPLAPIDRKEKATGGTTKTGIYAGGSFTGVIIDPPASDGSNSLSPASSTPWKPPACYYAPRWLASEFKAWWESYAEPEAHRTHDRGDASAIVEDHKARYGVDSEYNDHNIEREDEGSWWTVHTNPDADSEDRQACERSIFWVDHGEAPDPGPGVPDALTLAELAYAHVDIPELEFGLSPEAAAQKVNLSTWVWVPEAELVPVSVTARLDGYAALSSTVTATPVSLTIDPGTDDATVHAGSGGCAVSSSGAIGERWDSSKAGLTPPCGVTYGRATHDGGSYALGATVTWEVSWSGSDGSGGELPAGEFASTQEVRVQEVQTVVR